MLFKIDEINKWVFVIDDDDLHKLVALVGRTKSGTTNMWEKGLSVAFNGPEKYGTRYSVRPTSNCVVGEACPSLEFISNKGP